MEKTRIIIFIILTAILFCAGLFAAGFFVGSRRSVGSDNEYQNRITELEAINTVLQGTVDELERSDGEFRSRLEEIQRRNDDIAAGVAAAKRIISGIDERIGADGDSLQRAFNALDRLERALQFIINAIENQN